MHSYNMSGNPAYGMYDVPTNIIILIIIINNIIAKL